MKRILLCLWLTCSLSLMAAPPPGFEERMADAIYLAEGGAKTRWPYGVKSVKTSNPRQVTINSIRNNWARWEKAGKPCPFVEFMARRWCPPSSDPQGHTNWIKNVNALMK